MSHYREVPRFFASLRMTMSGGKVSGAITLPPIGGIIKKLIAR